MKRKWDCVCCLECQCGKGDKRTLESVFDCDQNILIDQSDESSQEESGNFHLRAKDDRLINKTPAPVSLMSRKDLIKYSTTEIMIEHHSNGGKLKQIQPSYPDLEPDEWPNYIYPWTDLICSFEHLKKTEIVNKTGNKNMNITELLKTFLRRYLLSKGKDPENYFRSDYTEEKRHKQLKARGFHSEAAVESKINDSALEDENDLSCNKNVEKTPNKMELNISNHDYNNDNQGTENYTKETCNQQPADLKVSDDEIKVEPDNPKRKLVLNASSSPDYDNSQSKVPPQKKK